MAVMDKPNPLVVDQPLRPNVGNTSVGLPPRLRTRVDQAAQERRPIGFYSWPRSDPG